MVDRVAGAVVQLGSKISKVVHRRGPDIGSWGHIIARVTIRHNFIRGMRATWYSCRTALQWLVSRPRRLAEREASFDIALHQPAAEAGNLQSRRKRKEVF